VSQPRFGFDSAEQRRDRIWSGLEERIVGNLSGLEEKFMGDYVWLTIGYC